MLFRVSSSGIEWSLLLKSGNIFYRFWWAVNGHKSCHASHYGSEGYRNLRSRLTGRLGALLIGYYEKDNLRFAGKVGTGFTSQEARSLLENLQQRTVRTSPFGASPADVRREGRFIEPKLVAHINFGEWTPDGKLRHASFQGLREDKPAQEVVREKEKSLTAIPDINTAVTPRKRSREANNPPSRRNCWRMPATAPSASSAVPEGLDNNAFFNATPAKE